MRIWSDTQLHDNLSKILEQRGKYGPGGTGPEAAAMLQDIELKFHNLLAEKVVTIRQEYEELFMLHCPKGTR